MSFRNVRRVTVPTLDGPVEVDCYLPAPDAPFGASQLLSPGEPPSDTAFVVTEVSSGRAIPFSTARLPAALLLAGALSDAFPDIAEDRCPAGNGPEYDEWLASNAAMLRCVAQIRDDWRSLLLRWAA